MLEEYSGRCLITTGTSGASPLMTAPQLNIPTGIATAVDDDPAADGPPATDDAPPSMLEAPATDEVPPEETPPVEDVPATAEAPPDADEVPPVDSDAPPEADDPATEDSPPASDDEPADPPTLDAAGATSSSSLLHAVIAKPNARTKNHTFFIGFLLSSYENL